MAAYTVTRTMSFAKALTFFRRTFVRLTLIGFWTAVIAVVAGLAVPLLLAVQNIGWPWRLSRRARRAPRLSRRGAAWRAAPRADAGSPRCACGEPPGSR